MSRFISDLLSKEKAVLQASLEKFEEATGGPSHDIELTSEIIIQAKNKMRQLGLDPEDTTPEELYQSLLSLAGLHDKFLLKRLEVTDTESSAEILRKATQLTKKLSSNRAVWTLKHSTAKRLIEKNPPKELMKHLGYRSVSSMVKRAPVIEIFAGLNMVESQEFIDKFYKGFSKVTASDFEMRKIEIMFTDSARWQKIANSYVEEVRSNVVEVKELGGIIVLPIEIDKSAGLALTVTTKILERINEVLIFSNYFKFIQVQKDFGKLLIESLDDEARSHATMAGEELHWRVIHNHLKNLIKDEGAEVFEPQVSSSDLEYESVEESLYKLEPALHFWHGTSCLGLPYDGYSISFNLIDVATNYLNNLPVENSSKFYLKRSLWDELLKRYLLEKPLEDQVIGQLDNILSTNEYDDSGSMDGAVLA
jgi:hypothetical protein